MERWLQRQPIILVRQQFKQLLHHSNNEEPLRNQLVIDFPIEMGLRTKEIRVALWEDADIATGRLIITDSKSHKLYPIPMPYSIAEKLERYRQQQSSHGFIIRRLLGASYRQKRADKPVGRTIVENIWHDVADRAGLSHPELYTPRLGRHYFAAMWNKCGGNLEVLRRILRHKNLAYTQIYLSRLIFFEDVKAEYGRIHKLPIEGGDVPSLYNQQYEQVELREECLSCPAVHVCKHKEELARCEAASGCKFRKKILESAKH